MANRRGNAKWQKDKRLQKEEYDFSCFDNMWETAVHATKNEPFSTIKNKIDSANVDERIGGLYVNVELKEMLKKFHSTSEQEKKLCKFYHDDPNIMVNAMIHKFSAAGYNTKLAVQTPELMKLVVLLYLAGQPLVHLNIARRNDTRVRDLLKKDSNPGVRIRKMILKLYLLSSPHDTLWENLKIGHEVLADVAEPQMLSELIPTIQLIGLIWLAYQASIAFAGMKKQAKTAVKKLEKRIANEKTQFKKELNVMVDSIGKKMDKQMDETVDKTLHKVATVFSLPPILSGLQLMIDTAFSHIKGMVTSIISNEICQKAFTGVFLIGTLYGLYRLAVKAVEVSTAKLIYSYGLSMVVGKEVAIAQSDEDEENIAFSAFGIFMSKLLSSSISLSSFMKKFGIFAVTFNSVSTMMERLAKLVMPVFEWSYEKIMGEPWSSVKQDQKEVRDTLEHLNSQLDDYAKSGSLTADKAKEFIDTYSQLQKYSYILSKLKDQSLNQVVLTTLTKHLEHYMKCQSFDANQTSRRKPCWIHIVGKPGVGKTWLKDVMCQVLHQMISGRRFDSHSVYDRKVANDFWDGYNGQLFTIYDDFLQRKEPKDLRCAEALELIFAANTNPFHLHMSSISDKALKYFTSKVIITTSNYDGHSYLPNDVGLTDNGALHRRMDFRILVKGIHEDYVFDKTRNRWADAVARYDIMYLDQNGKQLASDNCLGQFLTCFRDKWEKAEADHQYMSNPEDYAAEIGRPIARQQMDGGEEVEIEDIFTEEELEVMRKTQIEHDRKMNNIPSPIEDFKLSRKPVEVCDEVPNRMQKIWEEIQKAEAVVDTIAKDIEKDPHHNDNYDRIRNYAEYKTVSYNMKGKIADLKDQIHERIDKLQPTIDEVQDYHHVTNTHEDPPEVVRVVDDTESDDEYQELPQEEPEREMDLDKLLSEGWKNLEEFKKWVKANPQVARHYQAEKKAQEEKKRVKTLPEKILKNAQEVVGIPGKIFNASVDLSSKAAEKVEEAIFKDRTPDPEMPKEQIRETFGTKAFKAVKKAAAIADKQTAKSKQFAQQMPLYTAAKIAIGTVIGYALGYLATIAIVFIIKMAKRVYSMLFSDTGVLSQSLDPRMENRQKRQFLKKVKGIQGYKPPVKKNVISEQQTDEGLKSITVRAAGNTEYVGFEEEGAIKKQHIFFVTNLQAFTASHVFKGPLKIKRLYFFWGPTDQTDGGFWIGANDYKVVQIPDSDLVRLDFKDGIMPYKKDLRNQLPSIEDEKHDCEGKQVARLTFAPDGTFFLQTSTETYHHETCISAGLDGIQHEYPLSYLCPGIKGEGGECGVPYFNPKCEKKIAGIHIAGYGKDSWMAPIYIEYLNVEMVAAEHSFMGNPIFPKASGLSVDETKGRSLYEGLRVIGGLQKHGKPHTYFMNDNNDIVPTIVQKPVSFQGVVVQPPYEIEKVPAKLKRFHQKGPDGRMHVVDPLKNAMTRFRGRQAPPMPEFKDSDWEGVFGHVNWNEIREPLTIDQAVLGIPGDEMLGPMDRKSSSGPGFSERGVSLKDLIPEDSEGKHFVSDELREYVTEQILAVERSEIPPLVSTLSVKCELKKKGKELKPRVFMNGEKGHMIRSKMFFGQILKEICGDHVTGDIAIGINPHGYEWTRLAKKFDANFKGGEGDETMIASDMEAWDFNTKAFWGMQIFKQVESRMRASRPHSAALNYWMRQLEAVLISPFFSWVIISAMVYAFTGMPSGCLITATANSIINSVMNRAMFRMEVTEKGGPIFKEACRLSCFGDDLAMRVFAMYKKWWDQQKLAEATKKYFNMTMTTITKDGSEFTKFMKIETFSWDPSRVQFLKRQWRFENGLCFPILDPESIRSMVLWIKPSRDVTEDMLLKQNIETAMREWSYYGKQRYEEEWNKLLPYYLKVAKTGNLPFTFGDLFVASVTY